MQVKDIARKENYTYCINGQWTVYHADLDNMTVGIIDYATMKVWVR